MSSPDSESLISEISHSLPIPDLIKHLMHTFLVRDFNEVQNILMNRENDMKTEIENIARDLDSAKNEICLLERTASLAELGKSEFEKELRKNQKKLEELEKTITKLFEGKRVSIDREKKAERLEMIDETNKSIFELNRKINELETENLENDRLVGVYKEKCECLDRKVVKMGQEIDDLKHERLGATRTIEELRRKLSDYEKVVEELKCRNVEANRTVDELRLKILESDKATEFNKSRVEKLAPRIMKIEESLADMLNVKVGDLANSVGGMFKLGTLEGGNLLDFQGFKGRKEISGNGGTRGDAENIAVVSPGVCSTSNSIGSKSIGLSNKGDGNLTQFSTGDDVAHTVKTSPGSQSGAHASDTRLMSGEGRLGNIIEILDSDDEASPPGTARFSNREVGSDAGENEMSFDKKFGPSPSSSLGCKRNRTTDCGKDFFANFVTKRKRNMCSKDDEEEDNNNNNNNNNNDDDDDDDVSIDIQTPPKIFNDLNDEDSTDSDESCSDAAIDNLVASLTSNQLQRKYMHKADMSRAFQENEELCMNAVCALYRRQIFAEKSTQHPKSSRDEGFSHVDSMSGRALAEYLIDGDKELRRRKSVAQVKKERPDVINQCRKLANIYIEKLFEIYCSGKDRLFGQ